MFCKNIVKDMLLKKIHPLKWMYNKDFIGNRLASNVKVSITLQPNIVLLFRWINMIGNRDYPHH